MVEEWKDIWEAGRLVTLRRLEDEKSDLLDFREHRRCSS